MKLIPDSLLFRRRAGRRFTRAVRFLLLLPELAFGGAGGVDKPASTLNCIDSLLCLAPSLLCRRLSEFELLARNRIGQVRSGLLRSGGFFRVFERGVRLYLLTSRRFQCLLRLLCLANQIRNLPLSRLHVGPDLLDALHLFMREPDLFRSEGAILKLLSKPLQGFAALQLVSQ